MVLPAKLRLAFDSTTPSPIAGYQEPKLLAKTETIDPRSAGFAAELMVPSWFRTAAGPAPRPFHDDLARGHGPSGHAGGIGHAAHTEGTGRGEIHLGDESLTGGNPGRSRSGSEIGGIGHASYVGVAGFVERQAKSLLPGAAPQKRGV